MLYLICFFISFAIFLIIASNARVFDHNILLLVFVVTISNGGYYSISSADSLETAILGNKLAYVASVFAPMLIFLIICNICRIKLPSALRSAIFFLQAVIYVSVCTIGKYPVFYKKVKFGINDGFGYLTKVYGPFHTLCVVMMIIYMIGGIVIGLISLNRKNVVSRINVEVLLFSEALAIAVYLIERFVHMKYELLPVVLVFTMSIILVPLAKIYRYSLYNNSSILDSDKSGTGYIVFDKKLNYMGSNDYAASLFPELSEWELEKKIPGNGGRFNTFLRQPLMSFVNESGAEDGLTKTYEHQGETFSCRMNRMLAANKKVIGYYVRITDITRLINKQ